MPYLLERVLFIPWPRKEVFAFFASAENLERITPAFLHFHFETPLPIAMRQGTRIEYRLRLYGLPVHWKTLIESYEPESSFVDVQLKGPYRLWRHRHDFEDAAGGTLMRDRVEYDLPFGLIGRAVHGLFVRRTVERIFDHRNATILEIFGK